MSLLLAILPAQARADMFSFTNITNTVGNPDLSSQLSVEVNPILTDSTITAVSFLFKNAVGIDSSVTEVYFYDGTFIQPPPTAVEQIGVSFGQPTNPAYLPGYSALPTVVYSTDSGAGGGSQPQNGIDAAADSLKLTFDLFSDTTYDQLLTGLGSGAFVIGLHVTSIGENSGSDSYITTPLPGAVLLGILGLGAAGMRLRKYV